MSEKKHIEGPWRFVEREVLEDGSVYPQHIVGGQKEIQVCLLEGPAVAAAAVKNNWPEGKPRSADLILAAPDLFEVCKAFSDYLTGPTAWTQEQEDALSEQVHDAIAKATGAQS